jgi:hypothetical protein
MRRRFNLEELSDRIVPTYYGNQLFPLDNPWNQKIDTAPVSGNSAAIISAIVNRHGGTAPRLHADFGNPLDGNLYGIPINIATSSTPKYTITISSEGYADESDDVQVPIPANPVIEGDGPTGPAPPTSRGDSHLLVYDRDANVLYELYNAIRPNETTYPYGGTKPVGVWGAYQVSYWDLKTNDFRTIGATSADAAGLPILTGLVRPDEVNPASEGGVGVIDHAIRMTVQKTRDMFVFPASHEASNLTASNLPRMGERFRLKASFVIPTTWSPEAKAIAQAMKTYGMIVADNGSDMYFTGTPSTAWDMDEVLQVQSIRATDFEVVDMTPVVTGLSASSGSTGGGTVVTITGKNFGGSAGSLAVLFGTTPATSVTILSDTQVRAVAPAHAAGTVDVFVRSGSMQPNTNGQQVFFGYGTSAASAASKFTYDTGGQTPTNPTAAADSYSVVHDRVLTVSAGSGVLANDTSNPAGRPLTAALVAGPAHGTLTLNSNGSFNYTPNLGYVGSDTFTYTANDGALASAATTVSLSVTNQAPVAAANSYSTSAGQTLTIAAAGVLANDTDANGDALTAVLVGNPANGSLALNANGSFTYTPNVGFTGTDTFTYKANDKAADSANATVSINVTAVSSAPKVKSVVFNDGSAQRSLIRSITVTFDTLVTFDANAFSVVRTNGTRPTLTRTISQVNGETRVVLTFSGNGTNARSLSDGLWTLKVVGARVHRLDNPAVVMAADSVTTFHRFFGDSDGDRDVDATDKVAFDAAFGQTTPAALSAFDVDRDGDVDGVDRNAFNKRFGKSL